MCCDRAAAVNDRAAARRGSERRPQNRREACYPCRTCMDSSFLLLTRAGHPWRGYFVMGLTLDALRPRSNAGRGKRSGG